jgi:tetratricopeptide (TPR) repeat protein
VRLWDHHVAAEDWPATAELLAGRAESLADDRERVRALLKLANLLDDKLGDMNAAVDAYHRVLAIDPDNRRALWALGVLYHDLEDWEKVIEIYLLRIGLAESLEEKLTLRSQLAAIYEQRLQQEDRALMEYIRAARLAPQNVRILLNMEQLATRTESFRELLAVYEDVVERIERLELRVALYLKLARLYTIHLEDEQTAGGYYDRALELATGQPDMLFSISNIYGEEEEWEELIATYTQLIRHAEAPQVKTRLRREVARLYREGLDDPAAAFYELVRVARYNPAEPGLVDELFDLGTETERHLELAAVLEDIGPRLESTPAKVALYTRLARLHLEDLQNAEQARTVIGRALELDPADLSAQLVRFDLLEAGREYEALARALDELLARGGLPDEVTKQQRRRLARLCEEKLDQRARAVELYRENMREPDEPDGGEQRREILEQLYRRQGMYDELLKLLADRAKESEDPQELAAIALEMAALYEKQLDQPERAFFELVRAVRQNPDAQALLDELFRLGQAGGLETELIAVCTDLGGALDDPAAAELQVRLALALEAMGQPEDAAEHYERALLLDPVQPVAYQKLRARAENHFQWDQVVEIDLVRAGRVADPREKVELLLTAAELLEEQLADAGRAADVYDRVLSIEPESVAAAKALARLRGEAARVAEPAPEAEAADESAPAPPPVAEGPGDLSATLDAAAEQAMDDGQTIPATRREEIAARALTDRGPAAAPAASEGEEDMAEVVSPPAAPAGPVADDEEPAEVVSPPRPPVEPEPALAGREIDQGDEQDEELEEVTDVVTLPQRGGRSGGAEPRPWEDREPTVVDAPPPQAAERPPEPPAKAATTTSQPPATRPPSAEPPPTPPPSPKASDEPPPSPAAAADGAEPPPSPPAAADGAEPPPSPPAAADGAEPPPSPPAAGGVEPPPSPAAAGGVEPPPSPAAAADTAQELLDDGDYDPDLDTGPMEEEGTRPAAAPDPVEAMQRIVEADPADAGSWEKLAEHIQQRDGDEAAFAALEGGLERMPAAEDRARLLRRMSLLARSPGLRLRLGELLEGLGRLDDAESSYRSVLRSEPAQPAALDGLERIYRSRGALDRYDAILTRSLNGVTDAPSKQALLHRRAALRHRQLDRDDDALADLEQLLLIDDGDREALAASEDILESRGRYDQLIQAYQRHLPFSLTTDERVDLLCAIAILYENQLGNTDEAIVHYRKALKEDPGHYSALDSLVGLLERRRDWLGAIEVLGPAIDRIDDEDLAGELHCRMGKILEEQLLRPEEAEAAYRRAIDRRRPNPDALLALRSLARRRGDWVEVIRLGKLRLAALEDPEQRCEQLLDLAHIWRDRLGNQAAALDCFEQLLELDPDNLEATREVAGRRFEDKNLAEAHQLLARLAERGSAQGLEAEELAGVQLKLAQTAEALERLDEAGQAYERALELAPTDHEVLTQYGYFLARQERWQRAVELYAALLERHGAAMQPEEVADLRCLMAQGHDKLGRPERAAAQYRLALEANPRHLPALRASIELAHQLGRVRDSVELLGRLRQLLPSPTSRMKLSIQIGDLLAGRLHDPQGAAEAYQEALEQEPHNAELLEKLRRSLVHGERFTEAVAVLGRLAHLAESDRQRARYLRIAGDIQRERLDDDRAALDSYLAALDAAPLDKRANAAAVKILNRLRDWPRLARLYEEQLQRLPPPIAGQDDRRLGILTELVELYRYRLEDRQRAIGACEQLLAIEPGRIKVREDLARLSEMQGDTDRAIELHRSLIADSPFSVDSYHALRRIYEARGQADRTLCLAATLAFLDEADADEQALLNEHRHALPIPVGRRMNEALYNSHLLHPAAAGLLGEMLSFAADFARTLFSVEHKEFKLRSRDRLNLRRPDDKLAEIVRGSLELLGLPAPEFYAKGGVIKGIMAVNTSPVAVLYSEDAVRRATVPELRFMVARALAFTRPENLLAASLTPKQLRTLLEAMVELAFPGGPIHPVAEEVTGLARKLQRQIPERKQQRLLQLADQYRGLAEDLSIRDWLEGVEHTCNRAGLAFSGDLEAAVQVLKAARVVSPSGSHRSLIRELIFYSISEDYFALREALHAAI